MFFTTTLRSDARQVPFLNQQEVQSNHHLPAADCHSSSDSFISSSPPATPHRSSINLPHPTTSSSSRGCLTPASSHLSLEPTRRLKDSPRRPLTPASSLRPSKRSVSRNRPFLPPQPVFSLHIDTQHAESLFSNMIASSSRSASPVARQSRAMSVTRPELPRPPSRCESLLRDTLRRDDAERVYCHRSGSRSPRRFTTTSRTSRPRGNSFMQALKGEDLEASDCEYDDCLFARGVVASEHQRGTCEFHRAMMASAPRAVYDPAHARYNTTDQGSYPYGSPSSPSPMPPTMQRTRTAPTVPRSSKPYIRDEEQAASTRPPPVERKSLPNAVSNSHGMTSGESSPLQQRQYPTSPHSSVLKAKLESVLAKAGPGSFEDADAHGRVGRARHHQRAFSHGVTVTTSAPRQREEPSPGSPSPLSLNGTSTSYSATDLARAYSSPTHRRDSRTERSSPSSPPEPLTPPLTPPAFNARIASEACKRMDGYVSFANVEGLGEPPGTDYDQEIPDKNSSGWKTWIRVFSITHNSADTGAPLPTGRDRSNSGSS